MAARQNIRSVTLDHVNDAADTFIDDNEHFASLWSYAGSDRRRFILALIHRASSGPDALYLAVLNELLSEHGVEIGDKDLVSDLEFLRELEMVHLSGNKKGGGCYELTIPLLGMWIDLQQDFVALEIKAKNETEEKRDR
jgi:type I restriction enzyme M protein